MNIAMVEARTDLEMIDEEKKSIDLAAIGDDEDDFDVKDSESNPFNKKESDA